MMISEHYLYNRFFSRLARCFSAILILGTAAVFWFAVPVSEAVDIRLDYLLASLFVFGCILGVALYASYRRVQSAT